MNSQESQQVLETLHDLADRAVEVMTFNRDESSFAVQMNYGRRDGSRGTNYLIVLRAGELPSWVGEKAAELHAAIEEHNNASCEFGFGKQEGEQ